MTASPPPVGRSRWQASGAARAHIDPVVAGHALVALGERCAHVVRARQTIPRRSIRASAMTGLWCRVLDITKSEVEATGCQRIRSLTA
jgi:hypothetical protein